jgi:glutaminase
VAGLLFIASILSALNPLTRSRPGKRVALVVENVVTFIAYVLSMVWQEFAISSTSISKFMTMSLTKKCFSPLIAFISLALFAFGVGVYAKENVLNSPPSKEVLQTLVQEAHDKFKDDNSGQNADYIPYLASVPSHLFGVVIATVDGQIFAAGDADYGFAIESVSKPFTMCLVMQEQGEEVVVEKIGVEPTGLPFNSVTAVEELKARSANPLVNAGAIASVSLIKAANADDRWNKILECFSQFAGEKLSLNQEVYQSEAATNQHNRGIAELLFSYGRLYCDPLEACDVYTRQCSVNVTARQLAVMGATLANGGINPMTKMHCLDAKYVPKVLAVMLTAGFYNEAGAWSWQTGLPAKTGVGGGIVAVVPGKMAIVGFAPPLDESGNSVRGANAIRYIDERLDLNLFDGCK